jgi:hypothetical protein
VCWFESSPGHKKKSGETERSAQFPPLFFFPPLSALFLTLLLSFAPALFLTLIEFKAFLLNCCGLFLVFIKRSIEKKFLFPVMFLVVVVTTTY